MTLSTPTVLDCIILSLEELPLQTWISPTSPRTMPMATKLSTKFNTSLVRGLKLLRKCFDWFARSPHGERVTLPVCGLIYRAFYHGCEAAKREEAGDLEACLVQNMFDLLIGPFLATKKEERAPSHQVGEIRQLRQSPRGVLRGRLCYPLGRVNYRARCKDLVDHQPRSLRLLHGV
jgi:hypothetical protein